MLYSEKSCYSERLKMLKNEGRLITQGGNETDNNRDNRAGWKV
jgi:hypothetical protein